MNGELLELEGKTIAEFLKEAGYDRGRLAVERNGEIVPRAQYGEVRFEEGDVVEVVRFVGGG